MHLSDFDILILLHFCVVFCVLSSMSMADRIEALINNGSDDEVYLKSKIGEELKKIGGTRSGRRRRGARVSGRELTAITLLAGGVSDGIGRKNRPPIRPFIVKCPRTNKKLSHIYLPEQQLAAIVWSHNQNALFGVNFADGGQIVDVLNESGAAMSGGEKWRTADGGFGLIFVANGGRYKVEIEEGGRRWFALRINEVDVREDSGEWKCQVMVRDARDGKVRVEAESRKSIADPWRGRQMVDGLQQQRGSEPAVEEQHQEAKMATNRQIRRTPAGAKGWKGKWNGARGGRESRRWMNPRADEGGTVFAFTKNDADFVVFERKDSDRQQKHYSEAIRSEDAIEYTRTEGEESSDKMWGPVMARRWSKIGGEKNSSSGALKTEAGIIQPKAIAAIAFVIFHNFYICLHAYIA